MSNTKRTFKGYESDLIALVDAVKAMNKTMSWEARKRVLIFLVKRTLGEKWDLTERLP